MEAANIQKQDKTHCRGTYCKNSLLDAYQTNTNKTLFQTPFFISTFHSNPPHYRHLHLENLLTSIPKNKQTQNTIRKPLSSSYL